MIEEQLLIYQLKQGKEAAYKLLYEKHYAVLCHLAREWVGDDYTAESLVGDVIFHLWEIRESLEMVFLKSRFERKKYEEIAAELGISVNTVKYHIKNALARLHDSLGKYLACLLAVFLA